MKIYKNKWFAKFAKKEKISDEKLIKAVKEIEAGNIDADYGGGVIKQRIARPGEGKSGGYRSIILYIKGNRAFFVYGFSKKDQDNITDDEAAYFKKLAKLTLVMSDADLMALLKEGIYEEVGNNG
ncbi:MAG: type II toxin-antitoxin system RelE/ParE family toxin [Pyrinomonadaceae bacterium]